MHLYREKLNWFTEIAFAIFPLAVAIFAVVMQISDYIKSGTFLRATHFKSVPCCDSFDFIVVGGGSAGAAVATRLAENPAVRVLLLEAGGSPNPFSYIPAAVPLLLTHPSTDWGYRTESQNRSALALKNRSVIWPRGIGLGGSSNANFMLYNKGNPRDFDRWSKHTGDARWAYSNVNKYFRRVEDYFGTWDGNGLHGKGGPLRVEAARYTPGLSYVLEAAREAGYEIRDNNGNDQRRGFSRFDFTQKRGLRFSTYRAYIKPNQWRKNLSIYRYSLATKLHFNNSMHAIGVTYLRHGLKEYASATKEIIVCGGAINSPQLLMLSGIGPRSHLEDIGIKTLVDLPVGENLQDHVTSIAGPLLLNKTGSSFVLHRDVSVGSLFEYVLKGNGILSSPAALTGLGFTSTSHSSPAWPDIMYSVVSIGISRVLAPLIDQMFGTGNLVQDFVAPYNGHDSHLVLVTLGLPKSRGYIRLRNKNPLSKPIIDPRYFSDPGNQDMSAMVQGIQQIVQLYENTTVFQRINAHILPKHIPNCEQHVFKSAEYYECFARQVTMTLYHPSCTCSMGKYGDPNAVVDSQLRVFGVKNLRVADASIMPFVPNANTNAPCIVIGEMVSDMIKSTWNLW